MSETDPQLSMSKRRKLGRGLSGMIGSPVPVDLSPAPAPAPARPPVRADDAASSLLPGSNGGMAEELPKSPRSEHTIIEVPIGSIIPNRNQPRRDFDEESLKSLARSIAEDGLMQPVLVRPGSGGGGTGGRYELIAGERRWRAARIAGLEKIPAIVRVAGDRASAELALIENVHRADLNAVERADAMAQLVARFGLTQQEVADKLGLERSSVANLIRLTELEEEIRDLIRTEQIGAGHGKALLAVAPGAGRVELARKAASEQWSVRELERRAKAMLRGTPTPPPAPARRDVVHADLERRIGERLGTKVRIRANREGTKGKLVIDFFGHDHFEGIVRHFGVGE